MLWNLSISASALMKLSLSIEEHSPMTPCIDLAQGPLIKGDCLL